MFSILSLNLYEKSNMKTYQAEYYDKTGKLIYEASFEANNQKEAWAMAQVHKRQTPEIQKAGRVRTVVASLVNLLKQAEKTLKDIDKAQKEYDEYRKGIN
jgi:hypothetical protein